MALEFFTIITKIIKFYIKKLAKFIKSYKNISKKNLFIIQIFLISDQFVTKNDLTKK